MIMLVAISLIIFASYGAKAATYQLYREYVHRERAQLMMAETFEVLEAIRLTEIQKNYLASWDNFIGTKEGDFKLVQEEGVEGFGLENFGGSFDDEDENVVRLYDNEENLDGMYTRLERRISIENFPPGTSGEADQKLVSCSIYWGLSGNYDADSIKQVTMEVLYSDDTLPAFVL